MFNRTYHVRANQQAVRDALRHLAGQSFYRPIELPDPRPKRRPRERGLPEQLKLPFDPLSDIFPEDE